MGGRRHAPSRKCGEAHSAERDARGSGPSAFGTSLLRKEGGRVVQQITGGREWSVRMQYSCMAVAQQDMQPMYIHYHTNLRSALPCRCLDGAQFANRAARGWQYVESICTGCNLYLLRSIRSLISFLFVISFDCHNAARLREEPNNIWPDMDTYMMHADSHNPVGERAGACAEDG